VQATLEELRVTREELRLRHEQLAAAHADLEAERQRYRELAHAAAEQARRAAERAAERLARLQQVTAALSEALTSEQVAEVIVTQALPALGANVGVVSVLSEDGAEFINLRITGYPPDVVDHYSRFPADAALPLADAVRSGAPVLLTTLQERHRRYPHLAGVTSPSGDGALAALPLLLRDRAIGALGLGFPTERRFSAEEWAFLLAITHQCAQALEHARLYDAERSARARAERETEERKRAEEALRQSEGQLRLALEAGRMGTWEWDIPSGQVSWCPGLEAIHGYAPGTFGRTYAAYLESVHPEDRAHVAQAIAHTMEQRSPHHIEYRLLGPDGSTRWVEGRGQLFCDPAGRPVRMLGICMDVTERKRAEEEIRRFVAILEATTDMVGMADLKGRPFYVNRAGRKMAGLGEDEDITSMTIYDSYPEWADRVVRDEGIPTALREGVWSGETAFRSRSGHEVPLLQVILAHKGADDKVEFLSTIARDITARKQAEEALRQQRDFAESLIETAQVIVLVLDLEGRIVRFNSYLEEVAGYRLEEVRGRDFFPLFVPPHQSAPIREKFLKAANELCVRGAVSPIRTRGGSELEIEWYVKTLKDPRGAAVGVLGIGTDITQLKQAQERALRAERLAAIGQMITGLAHESRNALQDIQACLEMLTLELQGQPEALDLAAGIQGAQDRLHRLFEDVRGYAAAIKLEPRHCHLGRVWGQAWEQLAGLRKGRRARLRAEVGNVDLHCMADPFRLEQVFRNILDNSLAACADPVDIAILASEAELDGRPALRLAVRDNGPGLSAEQREKLFEPFYTTKTQGTGLGLAIAQRIVEAHGGRLAVGPGTGRGTELLITLPRE
jgi:PAS domain S-box-containing protein